MDRLALRQSGGTDHAGFDSIRVKKGVFLVRFTSMLTLLPIADSHTACDLDNDRPVLLFSATSLLHPLASFSTLILGRLSYRLCLASCCEHRSYSDLYRR